MADPESPTTLPTAADRTLAAEAAGAVQAAYAALPKTGKPQPHEYTVLAGIVAYTAASEDDGEQMYQHHNQMRVVAIGTGTKCLGASKRSPAGDLLNDSHAEVIARRAFVAWVYQQLHHAAQQPQVQDTPGPPATETQHSLDSQHPACQPPASHTAPAGSSSRGQGVHSSQQAAFTWAPQAGRFVLRPGVRFAMYVSQSPCGDASIFGAAAAGCCRSQQGQEGEALPVEGSTATAAGQQQQQQPVGRTGAKVLRPLGAADVAQAAAAAAADAAAQQEQEAAAVPSVPTARDVEAGPQLLGVLRRKPGKGDPTLSLSCSDKLARWACLGLQGCLLSSLLQEPLYLSMLVVSVPCAGSSSSGGQQQQPDEQGAAVGAGQQGMQDSQGGGAAGCAASSSCPEGCPSAQQQMQTGAAAAELLAAAEAAGRRAFGQRLAGCAGVLRAPFRLLRPKVVAVQAADPGMGLQRDGQRVAASGTSINYTCQLPLFAAIAQQAAGKARPSSGAHEATAGALGRKAGAARKGPAATSIKTRSRLSSAALFEQWQALQQQMCALDGTQQEEGSGVLAERVQAKMVDGVAYQDVWSRLRAPDMPFASWIAK